MEPTLNITPSTPEDFSAFQPEYEEFLDAVEASFTDEQAEPVERDLSDIVRQHDEERCDPEDNFSDAEADADTLASAGMGTDEDYGYYGGEDF